MCFECDLHIILYFYWLPIIILSGLIGSLQPDQVPSELRLIGHTLPCKSKTNKTHIHILQSSHQRILIYQNVHKPKGKTNNTHINILESSQLPIYLGYLHRDLLLCLEGTTGSSVWNYLQPSIIKKITIYSKGYYSNCTLRLLT